jgi:hypothetical protein
VAIIKRSSAVETSGAIIVSWEVCQTVANNVELKFEKKKVLIEYRTLRCHCHLHSDLLSRREGVEW